LNAADRGGQTGRARSPRRFGSAAERVATNPQRAHCAVSVALASAACNFCLSTSVLDGKSLRWIGVRVSAEPFDDQFPLPHSAVAKRLGASSSLAPVGSSAASNAAAETNESPGVFGGASACKRVEGNVCQAVRDRR
jgi:hypothetical protein